MAPGQYAEETEPTIVRPGAQSMKPSNGPPLERQERWQARSQLSRCGRQLSASIAVTQDAMVQVHSVLHSRQQASDTQIAVERRAAGYGLAWTAPFGKITWGRLANE